MISAAKGPRSPRNAVRVLRLEPVVVPALRQALGGLAVEHDVVDRAAKREVGTQGEECPSRRRLDAFRIPAGGGAACTPAVAARAGQARCDRVGAGDGGDGVGDAIVGVIGQGHGLRDEIRLADRVGGDTACNRPVGVRGPCRSARKVAVGKHVDAASVAINPTERGGWIDIDSRADLVRLAVEGCARGTVELHLGRRGVCARDEGDRGIARPAATEIDQAGPRVRPRRLARSSR